MNDSVLLSKALMLTSAAEDQMKSMIGLVDFYNALKRFDAITFLHSESVARISVLLALQKGFDEDRLINLALSGYMHDIGKIFIGIDIIGKNGSLSDKEYAVVKEHPQIGYRHLKCFIDNEEILMGVLQHHERIDGSGYPRNIHNLEISEFGRILAVADVFSAMTSVRSYKDAVSEDSTLSQMIDSNSFDPDILAILVHLHEREVF